MIEVDIDEHPVVSRGMLSSWVSFAVSSITHLILFLALTLVVYGANKAGVVVLEAETTSQEEDLKNEVPMEIELSSEELAFESEPEVFEDSLEELESTEVVDWTTVLSETSIDNRHSDFGDGLGDEFAETTTGGFFGIQATGNKIVYIIDMSPSMEQGEYLRRFDRAVQEVLDSVDQLGEKQKFFVYLFCFEMREMDLEGSQTFCAPTKENKKKLAKWLREIELGPGTDPREALVAGLKMKPSCCFLLSDGEFNGRRWGTGKYGGGRRAPTAVTLAKKYNRSRCPIHTIGLEDEGSQKDMEKIAKQSKGLYKFIAAQRGPGG